MRKSTMPLSRHEKTKLIRLLNQHAKMIILNASDGSVRSITNMCTKKFDFCKLNEFLRMEGFRNDTINWGALYDEFYSKRVRMELVRTGKAVMVLGRVESKIYFIQVNLRLHQET